MMEPVRPGDRVVAMVASAGGLAAFIQVLGGLPADFPTPVLVLQHLATGAETALAGLLTRRTALPAEVARPRFAPRAGRIWVAPAGHHLVVTADRRLALRVGPKVRGVRPSADVLLTSIADVYGPAGIAVVLSGGRCDGVDGADGAAAVHAAGGTVIAQRPDTAARADMPSAAIATGCVDHVLPPGQIGLLLRSLTGVDGPWPVAATPA